MNAARAAVVDLRLDCHPGKEGKSLVFPYKVQNYGVADAYVMDRSSSVAPPAPAAKPNPQAAVVVHGPGDDVTVGKFIAPLPTDRRIAMPVIPLARLLAPGGTLEGLLEIPIPLAEISPYFADLPLWQYDVVEISGLVFSIGYWPAGTDGLAALPVEDAPELFTVVTRNTVRSARLVSQHFPTRSLQLFRRTDEFPRGIPSAAGSSAEGGGVRAARIGPAAAA
jgi:hypothetical protein